MLGLSVTCYGVGSVSRFPPFRNRDLLQPLSLVFRLSAYPASFFLYWLLCQGRLPQRGMLRLATGPTLWPLTCCLLCLPLKAVHFTGYHHAPGCLGYTDVRNLSAPVVTCLDALESVCVRLRVPESYTVWPNWEITGNLQAQVLR